MTKSLLTSVAALLALGATPALAQDYTGFSVGGQLLYGDAETDGPSLEGDDYLFGLRGYYDVDTGGLIYGGGAQIDTSDIDLDGVASIDSVFRLGGRVGGNVAGAYLYGTLGYAFATTGGDADAGDSNGYFVGVGYETFVTSNVTAGAEVLFHRFEDFDNISSLEADVATVGVNIGYRF